MAVDKLVDSTQLNSDLTSVANAIRTKGGTSASLAFPAGFVSAIGAITTGDAIDHEDLPSYVKAEALAVAERVKAHLQSDSIVFLACSDSHQSTTEHVADGNLHGGMAMKALAYVLPTTRLAAAPRPSPRGWSTSPRSMRTSRRRFTGCRSSGRRETMTRWATAMPRTATSP